MKVQKIERLLRAIDNFGNLSNKQKSNLVTNKFNSVNYKLYKYYSLSSEFTLSNIENDILFLNTPKAFNDPFDCFIGYPYQKLMENFCLTLILEDDFQMNEFEMEAFTKLILGENLSDLDKQFFNELIRKFGKEFNNTIIDEWVNQNIERRALLICYLLAEEGKELFCCIVSCCEKMLELQNNVRQAINENFIVTCFSETYNNELMWAHYADKHRGICVEYDMRKVESEPNIVYYMFFTFPVIYSKTRPQIPISFIHKENFHYSVQEGDYNLSDRYRFLLSKSTAWKYEREWRMILTGNPSNIIKFPLISNIYLGVNISEEHEQKVIDLANRKGITTQKLQLSTSNYTFN